MPIRVAMGKIILSSRAYYHRQINCPHAVSWKLEIITEPDKPNQRTPRNVSQYLFFKSFLTQSGNVSRIGLLSPLIISLNE